MTRRFGAIILMAWVGCVAAAVAGPAEDVKQRMEDRLPAVTEMKRQQAAGENNRGYLEVLDPARADKAVVRAENRDRKLVYQAIARETGTDVETVGRQRAKQIAKRSAPGIMLQDAQGAWEAKPSKK